jgi:hypothetical protein
MKPIIDIITFGSITINGITYDHDILITCNGEVLKRKKKLSKRVYGTSHVISLAEAEYIFNSEAEKVIIGAGHDGMVILSVEADDFFKLRNCPVILLPSPQAVESYNKSVGKIIGLFHVTC